MPHLVKFLHLRLLETGGQLSVVDEAGQIKAILSNIQGEIIGVTAQFSSGNK